MTYLGPFYQVSTKCMSCKERERVPLEPYCQTCIDGPTEVDYNEDYDEDEYDDD